jgi:hypothetical protein
MTLLSDTAYHSFIGEVEALNTTTIRRLTPSCRHQLLAIAPYPGDADRKLSIGALESLLEIRDNGSPQLYQDQGTRISIVALGQQPETRPDILVQITEASSPTTHANHGHLSPDTYGLVEGNGKRF